MPLGPVDDAGDHDPHADDLLPHGRVQFVQQAAIQLQHRLYDIFRVCAIKIRGAQRADHFALHVDTTDHHFVDVNVDAQSIHTVLANREHDRAAAHAVYVANANFFDHARLDHGIDKARDRRCAYADPLAQL